MEIFFIVLLLIVCMVALGFMVWIEVESKWPIWLAVAASILSPVLLTGFIFLIIANDAVGAFVGKIIGALAGIGFMFWIIGLFIGPFINPDPGRWKRSVWRGTHSNWKRFWLIAFPLSLLLTSCVSESEHQKVLDELSLAQSELAKLRSENESLEKELNAYQTDPAKLASEALQAFGNRDKGRLEDIKSLFLKYHPEDEASRKKIEGYLAEIGRIEAKEAAERERARKAEEAKRMLSVNKLKKKFDDVSGITWYQNPYFTHYNNSNHTSIYIGKDATSVWLRLKMSYYGDDWIFFSRAYLSYDGNTLEIPFDKYRDSDSDNSGGSVWEWVDVRVSDRMLQFLRNAVKSKDFKMRLSGKYTKTRNLSSQEVKAIEDVLLAYDVLLKGK